MKIASRGGTLLILTLVVACRSASVQYSDAALAECPVCKHEGDLACVSVSLGTDTPTCRCNGQTYYFCSDECRATFVEHSERYTKP